MNNEVKKFSVTYEDGPCGFNIKNTEVESTTEQKARALVKKKYPSAMITGVSEIQAKDNITIPLATVQQALEAWQTSSYGQPSHQKAMVLAMTALRAALYDQSQPKAEDQIKIKPRRP